MAFVEVNYLKPVIDLLEILVLHVKDTTKIFSIVKDQQLNFYPAIGCIIIH